VSSIPKATSNADKACRSTWCQKEPRHCELCVFALSYKKAACVCFVSGGDRVTSRVEQSVSQHYGAVVSLVVLALWCALHVCSVRGVRRIVCPPRRENLSFAVSAFDAGVDSVVEFAAMPPPISRPTWLQFLLDVQLECARLNIRVVREARRLFRVCSREDDDLVGNAVITYTHIYIHVSVALAACECVCVWLELDPTLSSRHGEELQQAQGELQWRQI
jgi:hypothetical protein